MNPVSIATRGYVDVVSGVNPVLIGLSGYAGESAVITPSPAPTNVGGGGVFSHEIDLSLFKKKDHTEEELMLILLAMESDDF